VIAAEVLAPEMSESRQTLRGRSFRWAHVSRRLEFRIAILACTIWLLFVQAYQPWNYHRPSGILEQAGFFLWRVGFNLAQNGPIAVFVGLSAIVVLVYMCGWVIRGFHDLSARAGAGAGSSSSPSTSRPQPPSTPAADISDHPRPRFPVVLRILMGATLIAFVIIFAATSGLIYHQPNLPTDRATGTLPPEAVQAPDYDAFAKKYGGVDVTPQRLSPAEAFTLAQPVSLPTGTWLIKPGQANGNSVLRIQNGADLDSMVKLVTAALPRRTLWSVYIRAHEEQTINGIESGGYLLRFVLGQNWNPETRKFLRDVSFYQAGDQLVFAETEPAAEKPGTYTELYVTLNEVIGGNLHRKGSTETAFDEGDSEAAPAEPIRLDSARALP
jgi:hypothetical protein